MSEEKNILNYTAADIEKYWNGKLSAAEMHALEKAAMDDPFLADALEGYKNVNLPDPGLDELKDKLDRRVGAFVPVINAKRNRYTWTRAAAAIIIIAGAGLLVQQLFFNTRKESPIAVLKENEKQSESAVTNQSAKMDSINKDVQPVQDTSAKQGEKISVTSGLNSFAIAPVDTSKKTDGSDVALQKNEKETVAADDVQVVANADRKSEPAKEKSDFGKTFNDSTALYDKKAEGALSVPKSQASRVSYENDRFMALNNTYNYRVVDAQRNPVPFANVMNTRDNVGTYTDIRGNFNLVSSDSILNVQIRSLGYNSTNYKLVPSNTQPGDLVLKEDERKETVVQNRPKVVPSRSRADTADIEEPEVGWGNYNTYVANNIKIPETRAKNTRSEVELSFDIDKTGQPINIKVTRSSQCKECDEEAKRLLKEGPKWKRKGKKSKATISIAVDQK